MRNLVGAGLALFVVVFAIAAGAMSVQPVVVDLRMAGRDVSAPVRVENTGPNPLPIEIRIVETDFSVDTVRASDRPSEDIMAFPPQAIIPPGETQVFRIQYVGDPDSERSRHFYAEVAQLPVELPEGQSAIQILYNFQVMVNVASLTAGPPQLVVQDAEIVENEDRHVVAFTVHNSALNYGYLSTNRLTVVHRNEAGQETLRRTLSPNDIQQTIGYGLVGPEMSRRFVSPIEVEGPAGTVEVSLTAQGR